MSCHSCLPMVGQTSHCGGLTLGRCFFLRYGANTKDFKILMAIMANFSLLLATFTNISAIIKPSKSLFMVPLNHQNDMLLSYHNLACQTKSNQSLLFNGIFSKSSGFVLCIHLVKSIYNVLVKRSKTLKVTDSCPV